MADKRTISALMLLAFSAPAGAQTDIAFLVETVCEAAPGLPMTHAALAAECVRPRLRGADDVVALQHHDWPARAEANQRRQGYQRSVSYMTRHRDGGLLAVQTFDFGGGERRFGAFDAGRGDGGQVAVIAGGAAHVSMTEDGSGGVQWFVGSRCRGEMEPLRSGWLLFGGARGGEWRSSVASLRITRSAAECPAVFDASYTRWRELAMDWPVLFDGVGEPARPALPTLRTILSEHFGGADPAAADHMERFFLTESVGLIRWERWENADRSRRPDVAQRAERLALSGRCPEVAGDGPPADRWLRIDCRTWTNFVDAPDSAAGFDWRAARGEAR